MKNLSTAVIAAAFSLVAASVPVGAQTLDFFNRPDSTNLGANWTDATGSWSIVGGKATNAPNSQYNLTVYNAANATSAQVDIFKAATNTLDYAGVVLGYKDLDNNIFIKVQNNNSGLNFDRIFGYFGNNGEGNFFDLTSPFSSGRLAATLVGNRVNVSIDPDFTGTAIQNYSFTYSESQIAALGNQIGLNGYGGGSTYDNFGTVASAALPVPEPSTLGATALAGLVVMWLKRKQKQLVRENR